MKPSIILLLVCLLCADAQRRAPSRDAPEPEKQPDKAPSHPRGRGRARFTTTPEFTQITEAQKQETTTRKRVNPVALERRTQTAPASRTYEVSEIVEESPIDSFKRQSKPRVLTESRFEARNAPKKPLFEPAPSTPEPTVDELLKSFGSNLETTIPDISITTIKQDLDSTSEDSEIASANNVLPSTEPSKQDNEIKKENSKAPETTTKTEQRRPQNRRVNVVARGRATPIQTEVSTQASRTRGRTRPTRKPEVTSASTTTASTRAALRTGRRRSEIPEPIKSRGPSVLLAEETREAPSRSRTGRRINNRVEEKSPEKITIDLNAAPVTNSNSRSRFSGKPTARSETSTPSRRAGSRFPSRTATTEASRSTTSALPVTKGTTHVRKALRSRTRVTTTTLSPPVFDEQKLEVLPLFETEAKTVLPAKTKRNFSGEEMSATETDNKFTAKPNDIQSRVTVSHRVETRKQTYFKRKVTKRPLVKETVVAEVTEVTSRSTARKRNNEIPVEIKGRIKVDDPKVSVSSSISRGRKKSSARNKSDLTSSEEDIEDGDNYPKEFKALIQAKKNKKESRLPPRTNPTTGRTNDVASTVPSTVPTVTTTTQSTTTTVTTEAVKENADLENEVLPKTTAPTFRPTRKRIVKVLEKTTPRRQPSTTRQKVVRSTTFAPIESTRTSHRFHAKFNSKPESSESSLRTEKNYKSSRNRYSSRKSKETVKEEKSGKVPTEPTIKPTQISRNAAGAKKSNRFSAKYRGDTSLRGARSSTAAPAYIPTIPTAPYVPTIPTLVPPTTTIKWSKGTLDKDLGLEVLTIDDPVAYTVPSANLVNEEFVSPTNSNRLSNSVVTTTEKPVSIIERIINSITAISTTAVPDAMTTPFTTPKTEPSAILKLATKKPTKQDKTQPDKTNNPSITTEKPTTIIERILSSLSAIQADDEINSNKVGNNFNTLSSPSTTPISRVTKSSRSIPSPTAQFSTINPLTILDEISDEQVLQKRTIGKLLSLLNGLTSTVKTQTIVVTPKPSNTLTTLTTTDSTLFTSTPLQDDVNINSRFNVDSTEAAVPSTVQSSTEPPSTTVPSTESITTAVTEASSVPSTEAAGSTTEAVTSTVRTTDESSTVSKEIATPNPLSLDSNDLGVLNLFVAPDVTRDLTESSTVGMEGEFTETVYTIPSTIPTLSNFEDNVDENTVPSVDLNSPNLSTSTSGSPTVSTSTPNTSTLDTPTSTTSAGENREGKALDIDSTTINSPISTTEGASESVQSSTEQVVQITPEKALEIDSTTVSSQISTEGSNAAVESSTEPVVENKVEDAVTISAQISSTEGSSESAQSSTELVADKDSTTVVSQISTTEIPSATTEASTEAVVETRAGKALDINTVTSGPNESEQTSTEPAADVQSSTLTPQQLSTLSPELSTMLSILSTTLGGSSTTPSPTIPTLSELLNGRTLEAFNDLINNSKSNYQTLMVNQDGTSTVPPTTARTTLKPTESTSSVPSTTEPPKPTEPPTQPTTTEATTKPTEPPPPPSSSEVSVIGRVAEVPENTENILTTTTAEPIQTTTQTEPPVTTTLRTTTEAIRYTSTPTTTYQTFEPIVTSIRPTLAPITTLFPNFLTTLLSTLQPVTLAPPTTQETPKEVNTDQILAATTIAPSTSAPFLSTRGRVGYFDTISTDIPLTTRRRTQPPITITTNPPTTTQSPTRLPLTTRVSRTTIPTRTTIITSVPYVETTTSKRLKELTEEQKQNLKTLAELEKEQAALLNQLSILTSFANGGRKPASENGNLANRIIALAMDRDRTKTTTEGTTVSVRGGKKLEPSLDEVLKQYNLQGLESVTASPSPSSASTFGKSNEALIASLLKQQGIGPTTPSILQGIYTQTTTRPPRTTTRQPGRILQGLNWLLNALSPQPQAPRQKPRPKTTTSSPSDDELLTNLPTHITPVVTAAPKIRPNQLSQEDIKKLINQLETLQKNPRDSKALDFTQIKSLQNLINTNEGVLVTSSGESGTTRPSTRMIATTQLPAITTNLIVEEEDYVPTTTTRPRISLPPVRLNPVPGVDDENSDPYIRGNLITAAVNVTRAISSFLGSALQDAAFQFTKMFSSNPSSLLPNVANFTAISG
ncbi:mucin-5AC isoform X3 [Aethina tumida]|uniref:mucin-5AC isoform X3 n=1 Tax=Aethina tumida TaxID=116153 RepID=UPI002147FEBA|nr:mucin-5AC isoform X3 [Aethina tumida]